MCVLIFSINFVRNFSHSKHNNAASIIIMPSLSVCLSLANAALYKCKIVVSPRSSKCSVVLPPDIEYVTSIISAVINGLRIVRLSRIQVQVLN